MVNGHDVFERVFEPLIRIHPMLSADDPEGVDHAVMLGSIMASSE